MQDIMEREQEFRRRMESAGRHILAQARDELFLHMRFLDVALSSFSYVMDGSVETVATDGNFIYYNTRYLGGEFSTERKRINRIYLHMVLHCLFGHVFRQPQGAQEYWDLACDIAMESIIDDMQIRCVKLPVSWEREKLYKELRQELKVLTAEGICHVLEEKKPEEAELAKWRREFTVDEHSRWCRSPEHPRDVQTRDRWQDIREKMEMDMDTFSKEASEESGGLKEQLKVVQRETMDYRTFLKKFAVLKEAVQVDTDQFDYVFYSYGLSLYGNMPLIEPQETKEVKRIEEFAVVIDTSMSCSGELVRAFLEETYAILTEQETFFRRINLHIIQCDERVQADTKISSVEELEEYMEHFEIIGSGGTDFRPAFAYVEQLIREREFTNLKGLLYFTDGFGIYPKRMPPFETAFLFVEEEQADTGVPPWAMKLVIRRQDLQRHRKKE
ncbi:Predicted metal-dependent peptidase [Marvinbryantia formatexigens]|nr:VWA-like domain-containing protein [Marvinbryantia formatexigens]SDG68981.1 Predicted metal-dependent peptidase [Marvinbryantia formatexigens]